MTKKTIAPERLKEGLRSDLYIKILIISSFNNFKIKEKQWSMLMVVKKEVILRCVSERFEDGCHIRKERTLKEVG